MNLKKKIIKTKRLLINIVPIFIENILYKTKKVNYIELQFLKNLLKTKIILKNLMTK